MYVYKVDRYIDSTLMGETTKVSHSIIFFNPPAFSEASMANIVQ